RLVAGRVDEDELRALVGEDPLDAMARGLRLARRDRDVRADDLVEQRRLADVRAADDGDGAGAERLLRRLGLAPVAHAFFLAPAFSSSASTPSAAACSAARR